MMKELLAIWSKRRLVTAWDVGDKFEVSVLNADKMAYLEGFTRRFTEYEAAVDYATAVAHWFERVAA
jgi:hypothetical protein